MRKMFSWGTGLAAVALAAAVTAPANAVIGGNTASSAGPNVGVNAPSGSCSGTLINRRWVMSAAHCFEAGMTGEIQWGNTTRAQGQRATFSRVVTENDLALVRLDTDLPEGAVEFLALGDADPKVGDIVQFSGFGVDDSKTLSPVLRSGSAKVVESLATDSFGGPSWGTQSNGNGNTHPGDSGGGAFFNKKLVGVTSNGDATGSNFASVAAHRSFIDSTIREP